MRLPRDWTALWPSKRRQQTILAQLEMVDSPCGPDLHQPPAVPQFGKARSPLQCLLLETEAFRVRDCDSTALSNEVSLPSRRRRPIAPRLGVSDEVASMRYMHDLSGDPASVGMKDDYNCKNLGVAPELRRASLSLACLRLAHASRQL